MLAVWEIKAWLLLFPEAVTGFAKGWQVPTKLEEGQRFASRGADRGGGGHQEQVGVPAGLHPQDRDAVACRLGPVRVQGPEGIAEEHEPDRVSGRAGTKWDSDGMAVT